MDDLISRQEMIDLWEQYHPYIAIKACEYDAKLRQLPSVQSDNRLAKIADLVEGTIDHFDLDDAMDLLYQIKEIVGNETSNIRG